MRTDRSDDKRNLIIMLALLALAAALRLYDVGWGLPEVYEEAVPLQKAWKMWGWGPHRDLDLNPHFFNYPSLLFYINFVGQGILYLGMRVFGVVGSTVGYRVLYHTARTPFYLMSRLITVLFGVGTVLVLHRLGRKTAGAWAGAAAAFFLAVCTLHVAKSQMIEVDVPLTFFAVLSLFYAVRIPDAPTRRNYYLAGLFLGAATSIKYTGAFLGLAIIAAHVVARLRGPARSGRKKSAEGRPAWMLLAGAVVIGVATFLATSPFILLDWSTFYDHFRIERIHMELGHFGIDRAAVWRFYVDAFGSRIIGWPLWLVSVAGLVYLAVYRRRPWAIVLAAFFVPFFVVLSSWSMKADRYAMPIVPVALLFAGGMIAELAGVRRFARRSAARRLGAAAIVTLLLCVPTFASYPEHFERYETDTRTLAKKWIEANIEPGSFIAMEEYGPQLFRPHDLTTLDDDMRRRVSERMQGVPSYAVQPIPMFSLRPERAEVFYDLRLYEVADLVITSSMVKQRYMGDPARFRRQVSFYETLEIDFEKVQEFHPRGGPGPVVSIYRNPRNDVPFGKRRSVLPPRPLRHEGEILSGSEELFYKNLGVNYEASRFYREAIAAYDLAFNYPIVRPEVLNVLVVRKTLCLLALGRPREAVDFLDVMIRESDNPRTGAVFDSMRRDLLNRMNRNRRR